MSDSKRYNGIDPLGPLPTPHPPENDDDAPRTDPGLPVSSAYVKAKVAEAVEVAVTQARDTAWKAGWGAGIVGVLVAVGLAFGGWFRIEAMAQEKVDQGKRDAGAEVDRKLAPVQTDIAVIKSDLANINRKLDAQDTKQDEMIRLIKAKR